jgi:hypothetical protein
VTYTVQVQNTSPESVNLTGLIDDQFGNLSTKGCVLGTISSGDTYTCNYTSFVAGDAGEVLSSTTTALVWDDDGNSVSASDGTAVIVDDVLPTFTVVNQADVAAVDEPGGDVTYTVEVQNTSPESVDLTFLASDIFGNLDGQGDCVLGGSILTGGSYTCSFNMIISGNGGDTHSNTISASLTDNENNTATISVVSLVGIGDLAPTISINKTASVDSLAAPGGGVSFFAVVNNTSQENVTLTSLTDDNFGDLDGQGSCSLPQSINPGGAYSCSFSGTVSGNSGDVHTNVLTAIALDDEFNAVVENDDAVVLLTDDDIPTINLTKTPNLTTLPEPGGLVTFTIEIENTNDENVELISLLDDYFGDLDGLGTCSVPQIISFGSTYTCSFSGLINGNAGIGHTNIITAGVTDSSGSGNQSNDASVTITDVLPDLIVTLSSAAIEVVDPGENVNYSISIENTSIEEVILSGLSDDKFGDLHGQGNCAINTIIGIGDSYTCTFDGFVSGNAGDTFTNTVSALIHDDDGNQTSDDDSSTVVIIAPTPVIISGQVRNDTDFDGNLSDPEGGISGVMIELVDGNCVIGFTCPITFTNSGGNFSFSGVLPGDYVILEIDPNGYVSTADSQGANDNQISITVESGIDLDQNDFLDTNQTASIRGQVRDDHDGDGNLGDTDSGLAGVTVELPSGNCVLGVNCLSTTTNSFGYYEFNNVIAGEYIIVENDLPDFFSTGDIDLPNDNLIRITLLKGVDSNNNDFLDSINPSSCNPPDPVDGFVSSTNPADGQVIPLSSTTLSVVFNQAMATSGGGSVFDLGNFDNKVANLTHGGDVDLLSISYHAPSKTAALTLDSSDPNWLPGSEYRLKVKSGIKNACDTSQDMDVFVSFYTMSGVAGQVRNDKDADGNLGDGDQGIYGVTMELIKVGCSLGSCPTTTSDVNGYYLFADLDAGDYTLYQYDLPSYTSTADADGGNDNQIAVTVGDHQYVTGRDFLDTGSCNPPDPVDGFVSNTNPADGSILVSMSTNTIVVQFNQPMSTEGGGSALSFGNYHNKITNLSLGGDVPITAVDYDGDNYKATLYFDTTDSDWQLGSNYEIKIDDSLENACKVKQDVNITSVFQTTSAISGQVREDTDGDGNLNDNDPGFSSIYVELSDGSCTLGADCRIVTTNAGGFFIFPDVVPGNYTLYEYNLTGYTSTADSDGANNDVISVNLSAGLTSFNNDFLDTNLPLIKVSKEVNVSSVGEGSRDIDYTIIVDNISVETATLVSLSDDLFGNLEGQGTCTSGVSIASGNNYSCSFTQTITGNAGENHSSTIVAAVQDNSGNGTSDSDIAVVVFTDVLPSLTISSVPDRSEVDPTGQSVLFTVQVNNLSPESVTLIKLDDNKFGNLNGQGTCAVPQTIAVGGMFTCNFSGFVSGSIGDVKTNETKAEIQDDEGNKTSDFVNSSIDVVDILPTLVVTKTPRVNTIDPPMDVNFEIQVTNSSPEPVTLESLVDDTFGDLDGQGSCDISVTPVIPAFGGVYNCSFVGTVTGSHGESHINLVIAEISDDEGNLVEGTASATINIIDSIPSFIVSMVPDASEIDEPGGIVSFTLSIQNTSPEHITLLSLVDDIFGDLTSDCSLEDNIDIGETYTCIFAREINGVGGDIHTNTITVNVQDDEGNIESDTASASVAILDVVPTP